MNKNIVILGVVASLLIAIVVGFFFLNKKDTSKTEVATEEVISIDEGILPTVDGSVGVSLDNAVGGKEVILSLKGIPKGTNIIDYELSYEEKTKGLQGAIGTISLKGESTYEKKITLGTCSSGKCVYHEVVGPIKVVLKFGGSYGEKMFEKEYAI